MKKALLFIIIFTICPLTAATAGSNNNDYPAYPPKILSSELFPCSSCHAGMEPNILKRELTFHGEVKIIGHAEHERWCLDCHDARDRDKLRLINGSTVGFDRLFRLCGQCHGPTYRAWRAGVHGKRTGRWDGQKQYYLCSSCHDPHSPRFKALAPEPPPVRPGETIRN
ncbi:MAG: hypothetical protein C4526_00540 [Nitrospiraceae bacterium]|nr:MAG: hypothetical protein C4526_00540 [Nitrospiraceae bacterium]